MSVLVKGMDMPSSCADCQAYVMDGYSCWCVLMDRDVDDDTQVDERCPLVEVKVPHGRLIDANEALDVMTFEMSGTGYQTQACDIIRSDFYTPTVIEAEE